MAKEIYLANQPARFSLLELQTFGVTQIIRLVAFKSLLYFTVLVFVDTFRCSKTGT